MAEQLVCMGLEKIYSSPYNRTVQTAKIIQNQCGCPIEVVEDIKEINHGEWTGYTVNEVKQKWDREFRQRGEHPKKYAPPGGETLEGLQKRTVNALKRILKSEDIKKNFLVVTHGGNIHALWMYLSGLDIDLFWEFTQKHKIECGDIFVINNAERLNTEKNRLSVVRFNESKNE